MNAWISWINLTGKLFLLGGVTLNTVLLSERIRGKFSYFPILIYSIIPFFILFKVISVFGKESLASSFYTLTALALNFCLLRSLKRKENVFSLRRSLITTVRSHTSLIYVLVGLFTFFCLRGLYLEYPGDAIIYFQRVGQANQDSAAALTSLWKYNSTNTFFASFQQWLAGSDVLFREKLTLIAAISACLLCIATYWLTFWCTKSKASSIIAIFLSLAFYGNLQISFYLYKILQGATLAMIAYVEILPILYQFLLTPQMRDLWSHKKLYEFSSLILACWICLDSHQEKLLYVFAILLSASSLIVVKLILQKRRPPPIITTAVIIVIAVSIYYFFLNKGMKELNPILVTQWLSIGSIDLFSYWPSLRNSSYILLDLVCLGIIFAILSSAKVQSKQFFMAAVALSPSFLFLNPIIITGLLKLTNSLNIYRLMVGGIPWVFLPMACNFLEKQKNIKLKYLLGIFLFLGLMAYPPIFGKFPHLLTTVPDYANGRDLSPVVEHLLSYSEETQNRQLTVLSEPYTNSYLQAWPVFEVESNRWLVTDAELYDPELAYLFSAEISEKEVANLLSQKRYEIIVLNRRHDLSYQSWLASLTFHWSPDIIQSHQALFSGENLHQYLENHPSEYTKVLNVNGFQIYQMTALEASSDS